MIRLFVLLQLIFLLFACNNSSKETDSVKESITDKTELSIPIIGSVEPKIKVIDSLSNETLKQVRSLRWEKTSKEGSSFIEVSAFINADEFPLKIKEYFSETGFGKEGEHFYYFENNQLIAITSLYDEWIDSNTLEVVEQQHFFEEGEATYSRSRRALFLDELPEKKWEEIRPEPPSIDRAYSILRSEPPFTTNFISFIQGDESLFILLGEPKDTNRYITALKIGSKHPIIEKLYKNPEKYKYTPLKINFEVTGGHGSPEFRVLKDIQWED